MSREIAIKVIKSIIDAYIACYGEDETVSLPIDNIDVEALYLAIESLELDRR